jgi:glycosyltransferase involved in cell wall biosynthesis
MADKPYVTALIDTYNQGQFVEEAIESVLAQDFPADKMEILVVDDGSTDGTREQVLRFGQRVRYIYKENGGQASALNLGFAESRGKIVALLDADDLWMPSKVRRVVDEFEKHPDCGMVYHPMETWDVARNSFQKDLLFSGVSGFVPARIEGLLSYGDLSTSGIAFRRDCVAKLLPIPSSLSILADGYLGYLIIFLAPVAAMPECLTRYRIHGGNLCSFQRSSASQTERRIACSKAVADSVKSWLACQGYDLNRPEIAAYVKRHELVTQMVKMISVGATRAEFFSYLWDSQKLYAPIWTRRYRLFRTALALAGYVLGHDGFERIRNSYKSSRAFTAARQWTMPHEISKAPHHS